MARVLEAQYVLEAAKALVKAEQDVERKSTAEGSAELHATTHRRRAMLRMATQTAAEERDRCQHELLVRLTEAGLLTRAELEKEATARYFGCDWKLARRAPDDARLSAWKASKEGRA